MSSRLFLAPWWVNALVSGAGIGALIGIVSALKDDGGWFSLVLGTLCGLVAAAGAGWRTARDQAMFRRVAGFDLDDQQLRIVHRAAAKGPVPSDPRVKLAALHVATYDLSNRAGPGTSMAFLLLFPVFVVFMVFDSWWWVGLMPLYLFGVYDIWVQPRKLRARIELLSRDQPLP